MIRVVKPPAPASLLKRAAAATRALCEAYELAPDEYKSGARTFAFDSALYASKAVKDGLRDAQHKKCAFCESCFEATGYGDVEHFRPKAGYKQREKDKLKRPGYYWLAYEWANLFYSCQLCNQQFKQNLFPLKDGRRRARSHTHNLDKEKPLLVDPSRLDPADFIEFRGEYAHPTNGSREGITTIEEVLGLNREALVEIRRDRLKDLKVLVLAIDLLRKEVATAPTPDRSDILRDLEEMLQKRLGVTGEYAAMARAYLADFAPSGSGG
jgi:uncharacterized protein (TIGR02646 family)